MQLFFTSGVALAIAGLATLALRRRSAAERYQVWWLAMLALLALPLARVAAPSLPVELRGWGAAPAEAVAAPLRTVIRVTAGDEAPRIPWAGWWLAGAALSLARFAVAHARAARVARAARPVEAGVRVSAEVNVPMVCGLLRPVIVLPEESTTWTAGEREAVLAHERMHIARRDNFGQALTHLVCSLYWPQPLVWLAARAMRQECERACDDGVLAEGTPATAYAAVLVKIARGLSQRAAAPAGGLAMTRTTQLHQRIAALLDPGATRRPASAGFTASTAGLACGMVVLLAGLSPSLLAQQKLSGVVRDPSGAVIAKARVDLRTPGTDTVREVIYTNDAGEFSLDNVPDGTYDMTVAAPGFALLTQTNLLFENGKTKPFQVTLNLGKIRERVTVQGEGAPPPPPTGDGLAPKRIRVGGNVQASRLVYQLKPVYPVSAKQERVEGTVVLRAIVGVDGSVVSVERLNRAVDSRLAEAALTAVRQWRYSPTLLNGVPVEIVTEVDVNFTLAP